MEWLTTVRRAIEIIEDTLPGGISAQEVAERVFVSPLHLQRGFQVMTGYSLSEYIRCRNLYIAALELRQGERRIIDIAFDCGYDTPESFAKAFTRFHGSTPTQVRRGGSVRTFLPLNIKISVCGGDKMECKLTTMFGFKLIGFAKDFAFETASGEIPKFWDEICEKYAANVYAGNAPANEYERALIDNCIGEYAVCIDDPELAKEGKFRYLLAGKYTGGAVPEGMLLYEFPRGDWAVFDCFGPVPEAIQTLNTRIFREWLPGNPDYELSGCASVEWYDCINGEKSDSDYHSAVWVPIKRSKE